MPAARASPRYIGGTEPGALPNRGRRETVRSTDPAPGGACGRRSCNASSRRSHSTFFCAPCQADNPRLRITKASAHRRAGPETRESVCVDQSPTSECLGHPQIMPDFSSPKICIKPYEYRPCSVTNPSLLPTLKPEDPLILMRFSFEKIPYRAL